MKSLLAFVVLAIPAVQAAPKTAPVSKVSSSTTPPKARIVAEAPTTAKVYVSTSGASNAATAKSKQITKTGKPAARKVVRRAPATGTWHLVPKFEEGGKDDTTYGFLFKRRF